MVPAEARGRDETPLAIVETRDVENVVSLLVLSFVADPITRWMFDGSPSGHLHGFPKVMHALAQDCINAGAVDRTTDGGGVALWLPPGAPTDDDEMARVVSEAIPAHLQEDVSRLFEWAYSLAPKDPYWYLSLIGVDPIARGRGLGGALVEKRLQAVDRDKAPAYLWSSNPRNISLYRRFGFEVVETAHFGSSPVTTAMLRPPR